jgi:excisionase family DNA binding protein
MDSDKKPQFVDVPEAGRVLGVSESTVWRMIRRGALPSVRHGGRRLILRRVLEKTNRRLSTKQIPPFTEDNPLFRLVGAGRSGGHVPGARDKHAILDQ